MLNLQLPPDGIYALQDGIVKALSGLVRLLLLDLTNAARLGYVAPQRNEARSKSEKTRRVLKAAQSLLWDCVQASAICQSGTAHFISYRVYAFVQYRLKQLNCNFR